MGKFLAFVGTLLLVALVVLGINAIGTLAVVHGLGIPFKFQYIFIPTGIQIMALALPRLDINKG